MKTLENKIPPPLIAFIFAIAMWWLPAIVTIPMPLLLRWTTIVTLLGLGVIFSFQGIRSFIEKATTVNPLRPETASALVTTGVYRFSRNPMYLGMALVLAAWAVYLSSLMACFGVAGFVLYINRFQIAAEERALEGLFGAEFAQYRSQVRRWL